MWVKPIKEMRGGSPHYLLVQNSILCSMNQFLQQGICVLLKCNAARRQCLDGEEQHSK